MDCSIVSWSHAPLGSVSILPSIRGRSFGIRRCQTTPILLLPRRTAQFRGSRGRFTALIISCTGKKAQLDSSPMDCIGTGQDVECLVPGSASDSDSGGEFLLKKDEKSVAAEAPFSVSVAAKELWEWGVLISPFFFWGTAMVAMKEVLPKAGPFFVSSFRLIPAGLLLIAFASFQGRRPPSGLNAWLSIALFGLVDASCFQGFLAEGLERTSAGLGSVSPFPFLAFHQPIWCIVIIDSQPLTVAILAAFLFGESIGVVGAAGLVLGVIGLLLLEAPALSLDDKSFSLWGSGEWWMLLAAQSMAMGTVMVRWVSKYSDPVMATGWHMVIGGLPLLLISILNHDPAFSGGLGGFSMSNVLALLYTSVFGSAISYGVYFDNATRGSLTKLSSLTFLTPMFASIFGYLYLNETFSSLQFVGAAITLVAIYMVNYQKQSTD